MSNYDLTIVIVNWNTRDLLEQCLSQVYRHADTLQLQVIVIDNHSSDDSVDLVQKQFPQVELIKNADNLGYAKANNMGLRQAQAEFVLLLNSDVMIGEIVLSACLGEMQTRPKVGMLGVQLVGPDGKSQNTAFYRRTPSLLQFLCFYLSFDSVALRMPGLVRRLWASETRQSGVVDQIPGAFLLTRKTVLAQVGLLDERFFIFFEDVDWGVRNRQAGYVNYYAAEHTVTHVGSASFAKWGSDKTMRQFYRSLVIYVHKHWGLLADALVRGLLLLDSLCLIAGGWIWFAFSRGKPTDPLRAKIVSRWQMILQVVFGTQDRLLQ